MPEFEVLARMELFFQLLQVERDAPVRRVQDQRMLRIGLRYRQVDAGVARPGLQAAVDAVAVNQLEVRRMPEPVNRSASMLALLVVASTSPLSVPDLDAAVGSLDAGRGFDALQAQAGVRSVGAVDARLARRNAEADAAIAVGHGAYRARGAPCSPLASMVRSRIVSWREAVFVPRTRTSRCPSPTTSMAPLKLSTSSRPPGASLKS